jgi:hypothetical protein
MDRRDAAKLLELRQHLWPHTAKADDPAAEVGTWALLLRDFQIESAAASMVMLSNRPFAPSPGELVAAINADPDPAAVLLEFREKMLSGFSPLYSSPEKVPWSHPYVAAAARAGLWREFGLSPDPTYDEYGQANAANWRKAAERDVAAAISRYRSEQFALGKGSDVGISDGFLKGIEA